MKSKQFRLLILLYVALVVTTAIAGLVPGAYSKALNDAVENEPAPYIFENLWLMFGLVMPLAGATLAGLYGLYMFKRWGRMLSLCTTGAWLLSVPFLGVSLCSGLESALSEGSSLLWGVILALSYYSPVSAQYGAGNAPQAA